MNCRAWGRRSTNAYRRASFAVASASIRRSVDPSIWRQWRQTKSEPPMDTRESREATAAQPTLGCITRASLQGRFELRPSPHSNLIPSERLVPPPRPPHALPGRCSHDRRNARPAQHAPGFLGRAVAGSAALHAQRVLGHNTLLVRLTKKLRKQTALNLL